MGAILIRYGETGLKTNKVRTRFTGQLVANIHDSFMDAGLECTIDTVQGRHILTTPDQNKGVDLLSRVFGVVSVSPVVEFPSGLGELCAAVGDWSTDHIWEGQSFAIRARRAGTHPYTSMDVNREAGSAVYLANEEKGVKVDLGDPDVLIEVEVRGRSAFVYTDRIKGPGGLPYGSGGRLLCHLGSVRDALAAWMMMRRGCRTYLCHSDDELGGRLSGELARWVPGISSRPLEIPDGPEGGPGEALDGLMELKRARGFISGASVEEFGGGGYVTPAGSGTLVMYPLIGLGDSELGQFAEMAGLRGV